MEIIIQDIIDLDKTNEEKAKIISTLVAEGIEQALKNTLVKYLKRIPYHTKSNPYIEGKLEAVWFPAEQDFLEYISKNNVKEVVIDLEKEIWLKSLYPNIKINV